MTEQCNFDKKEVRESFRLINDDCLKAMDKLIDENIKIDAIICDPPY